LTAQQTPRFGDLRTAGVLLMVMTAMVMMAIAMVLVMVITVPEALGQVS
jgi:hypothetical protein